MSGSGLLWIVGGGVLVYLAGSYIRAQELRQQQQQEAAMPSYRPASSAMFVAPSAVDSGKITRLGPLDQTAVQLMTRQVNF